MRKLSTYFGGTILAGILVCGFIAYFMVSIDPSTHQQFDGFGRPLSESPWFMRMIFGEERLWVGWFWFIGDMIFFWGGIAVAFAFINIGEDGRK